MRTVYRYRENFMIKPKKVSKKSLELKYGKDYIKRITEEAKVHFLLEPLELYELGNGISITFE